MRKKNRKKRPEPAPHRFDHLASDAEIYTTAPSEDPLFDHSRTSAGPVHRTHRHQGASTEKMSGIDPRDKMAVIAILRLGFMILMLLIAFFLLWKGITIYEEKVWMDEVVAPEPSPVLQPLAVMESFDIRADESREQFARRIQQWKETDRLVRSADGLLLRNIYDQATEQCQKALRINPAHRGALERLGRLYYAKGDHVESVNAYIRLLSVDPSDRDVQKMLLQSLAAFGDYDAVLHMTEWYFEQNEYDSEIQRYLAQAKYATADFAGAAAAYERVQPDFPKDMGSMEQQADAYMQTEQFAEALVVLGRLKELNHRNQAYYRKIAICNAQLRHGQETVRVLSRAVYLFDEGIIMGWIQDPQLDPVRQDRTFQMFAERLAGGEFRRLLDQMAEGVEAKQRVRVDVGPMLGMPGRGEAQDGVRDIDLFKPRK